MIPQPGNFYFLDDSFFEDFPSNRIPRNKVPSQDHSGRRPYYCVFVDREEPEIFWMIPISSKLAKYSQLAAVKSAKFGDCINIRFASILGSVHPILIQNIFPVTPKYIVEQYIDKNSNTPVRISKKSHKDIHAKSMQVLRLYRRGIPVIFPDVDLIKKGLQNQLEQEHQAANQEHPPFPKKPSLDVILSNAQSRTAAKPPSPLQPISKETMII